MTEADAENDAADQTELNDSESSTETPTAEDAEESSAAEVERVETEVASNPESVVAGDDLEETSEAPEVAALDAAEGSEHRSTAADEVEGEEARVAALMQQYKAETEDEGLADRIAEATREIQNYAREHDLATPQQFGTWAHHHGQWSDWLQASNRDASQIVTEVPVELPGGRLGFADGVVVDSDGKATVHEFFTGTSHPERKESQVAGYAASPSMEEFGHTVEAKVDYVHEPEKENK